MSVVNGDYVATEAAMRRCLANGGYLSGHENVVALAVLQDAVARFGTGNTAATAAATALTTAQTALTAAATALTAALDTANAAIATTAAAAAGTAHTAALAGEISAPSLVASTNNIADGLPG
jgi:hypothetical protein